MSFIQELKRRNVFRVAIAYVITTWLLLQVADVVLGNIAAPGWVFKAIMLVLGLGFPVVLLFAWAFEMTPEGIKKEKDVDRTQSVTQTTGRKLDFTIIALLALGLAYFIWESRFSGSAPNVPLPTPTATETAPDLVGGRSAAESRAERAPTDSESHAAVPSNRKSIAALPFTTRSKLEDDQFFSDGMHDDLLTQLAKIGDLKVISRTSVMEYRDTTKNLRQIAAELGVASILEGAIQRSGSQVRINVQLIDAQTDEHLWAETYDRELTAENLFAIQTEIAKAIAEELHATLSPEEQQRIEQSALTLNLEALQAYQRGRLLAEQLDEENLTRAEQETALALELDPKFAAAWALQARIQIGFHWNVSNSNERLEAARQAIEQGRAIAPDLPELDVAEGYYYYHGFLDYANAMRILEPLLLSHPNNSEVRFVLGAVYRRQGRFDDALQQFHQALELDPRDLLVAGALSESYQALRDFPRAREYLAIAEAINPTGQYFYFQGGYFKYAVDGDPAGALQSWYHVQTLVRFEMWRANAAMGIFDLTQDFERFQGTEVTGNILLLPEFMHGLTLRLSGDSPAAQPWLDQAMAQYREKLVASPNDFHFLKPLCLAEGARNAAEPAAQVCHQALENLPDDQWDRNIHRTDIAGGLAMAGLNPEALDLIESVLSERAGPSRVEMQLDPTLLSLHEEPRWQALMAE